MQRNRIPHKLHAPLIPAPPVAVVTDELPCRDGAVDFEPAVGADDLRVGCAVKAEIVKEEGDGLDFGVDEGAQRGIVGGDEGAEQPAAHDVLVEGVARVVSHVLVGCADERGVDDGDAGYGAAREWAAGAVGVAGEGDCMGEDGEEGCREGDGGKFDGEHVDGKFLVLLPLLMRLSMC